MGAILRHSLVVVLKEWTTLLSAALTAVGAIGYIFSWPPSWLVWFLAVLAMLVSAIRIEWRGALERIANHNPEPRLNLQELMKRILRADDLFGPENARADEVAEALDAIAEKAGLGLFAVFGRHNTDRISVHFEQVPRSHIPNSWWRDRDGIDYSQFVSDRHGVTPPFDWSKGGERYYDLWFDERQTDKYWPRVKPPIDWRRPLSIRRK